MTTIIQHFYPKCPYIFLFFISFKHTSGSKIPCKVLPSPPLTPILVSTGGGRQMDSEGIPPVFLCHESLLSSFPFCTKTYVNTDSHCPSFHRLYFICICEGAKSFREVLDEPISVMSSCVSSGRKRRADGRGARL